MGQIYAKGNLLYAHLFEESVGPINLNGLAGKVKKARLLSDGSEVFLSRPWNAAQYPDDAFISFDRPSTPAIRCRIRGRQLWSLRYFNFKINI